MSRFTIKEVEDMRFNMNLNNYSGKQIAVIIDALNTLDKEENTEVLLTTTEGEDLINSDNSDIILLLFSIKQ